MTGDLVATHGWATAIIGVSLLFFAGVLVGLRLGFKLWRQTYNAGTIAIYRPGQHRRPS